MENVLFVLMYLPTTPNVKSNNIVVENALSFWQNNLDQIWKSFSTNFRYSWKVWKSSYQEMHILALFRNSLVFVFN